MRVGRTLETCLYVDDLAAAETFYREVLGLAFHSRAVGHVFFRNGDAMLLLFDPAASGDQTTLPAHGARGPGHLAFAIAATEHAAWRAHLRRHGVEIEAEVTWPGGVSIYFRDPAGNSLELAPPEIWEAPGDSPSSPS